MPRKSLKAMTDRELQQEKHKVNALRKAIEKEILRRFGEDAIEQFYGGKPK